ncbi:hypothetical protein JHK87_039616 [Glycine soja]|nr:hypothetical protein JHK87_039616 [Glycine soja]
MNTDLYDGVAIPKEVKIRVVEIIRGKPYSCPTLKAAKTKNSSTSNDQLGEDVFVEEAEWIEMVQAYKSPFEVEVHLAEAIYYSPYMKPIQVPKSYEEGSWKAYNLTTKGFEIETLIGPSTLAVCDL